MKKHLITECVKRLENHEELAMIKEVKGFADEFEKLVMKTDVLVDGLKAHGTVADVDVEGATGFSPARILQIAREQILLAEKTLESAEYYGNTHTKRVRRTINEDMGRLGQQKEILSACTNILVEFHDALVELYNISGESLLAPEVSNTAQAPTKRVPHVHSR